MLRTEQKCGNCAKQTQDQSMGASRGERGGRGSRGQQDAKISPKSLETIRKPFKMLSPPEEHKRCVSG